MTPLDLLQPGEARNDDYYDNLTASAKLGFDVTRNLDLGLVTRYTDSHLRVTGEDFSTFPGFPAARQSANNTAEYYTRATAHLVSPEGFLDQTLGLAYTRKRTANFEPASPYRDRFGLGLASIDFFRQLAEFHRRLRPASAVGHEFIELTVQLFFAGNECAKLRLFFP